jgi:hypothetical protein
MHRGHSYRRPQRTTSRCCRSQEKDSGGSKLLPTETDDSWHFAISPPTFQSFVSGLNRSLAQEFDLRIRRVQVFIVENGRNLRFRTDFFNSFNHPSFASPPSAVVAAPGPGLPAVGSAPITSVVGTPRLIQFSLKYSF